MAWGSALISAPTGRLTFHTRLQLHILYTLALIYGIVIKSSSEGNSLCTVQDEENNGKLPPEWQQTILR